MPPKPNVTLATLAGGALAERANRLLAEAVADCLDPNTPAEAVRQVAITISLKPDEERRRCAVSTSVKAKSAGLRTITSELYIGINDDGEVRMLEPEDLQGHLSLENMVGTR